jgi:hypothetical protein
MKNFIKLFGIIALVALIGFSMTACGGGSGDGGVDGIRLTGFYDDYSGRSYLLLISNDEDLYYYDCIASASGTIAGDIVIATLIDKNTFEPWIGSGSYYVGIQIGTTVFAAKTSTKKSINSSKTTLSIKDFDIVLMGN